MLRLKFPTSFEIDYPKKNINYYDNYGKMQLVPLLLDASKGYCMYCGKSIVNESDNDNYQVEHSVDKEGNVDQLPNEVTFLTHCKHNLALACKKCNQDCKKKIEKIRFGKIPHVKSCKSINCTEVCCSDYANLREQYCIKNSIILQPQGYKHNGKECEIIYNLIYNTYSPSNSIDEWETFLFVINHIRRFKLNGDRFSWSIIDIASEVVNFFERGIRDRNELIKSVKERSPSNRMGCIFLEFIEHDLKEVEIDKLVSLCETIVVSSAMN